MKKNLNQIRKEIDRLDEHILKLVSERGNLAKEGLVNLKVTALSISLIVKLV